MSTITLAVNGRFLTQAISGVQRFAHEMTGALAVIACAEPSLLSIEILVPRADLTSEPPGGLQVRRVGRLRGHAWEQFELPRHRGDALLFSPCNTGPVMVREQIVTIHDAQVFLTPETYSRRFRVAYRWLLPQIGRRARIVTTDSRFSRQALERYGVVAPGKAAVVYCGAEHIGGDMADERVLDRLDIRGKRYLLAIGSLSPHKNIRMLIEAVAPLDPAVPLIVAGGGNASIFANAGLGSTDRVRFIGRVSDAELRALYEHSSALLFPSFFEGFGLPPLEAMRFDCPVIASNTSAIPEVCGDAVDYAAPDRRDEWTDRVRYLLANDAHAADLRRRGAERIKAFRWRASAEQLIDLILEDRGAPPRFGRR